MTTLLIIACVIGAVSLCFIGVGSAFKQHYVTGWSFIVAGMGIAILPFYIQWMANRP